MTKRKPRPYIPDRPFIAYLRDAKGNIRVARAECMLDRKWSSDRWTEAMQGAFGDGVEAACREVPYP